MYRHGEFSGHVSQGRYFPGKGSLSYHGKPVQCSL